MTLVANGAIERYPNSASGYDAGTTRGPATSFSSPVVAGNAALLLHALNNSFGGGYPASAPQLFTNMLLMGDGWWAGWNSLDDTWGLENTGPGQSTSPSSGFGKVRMHFPSGSDPFIGSWKWTIPGAYTISQGQDAWWPANPNSSWANVQFPGDATLFKWAFTYFPTSMNDYGSMGMEIWEAPCNSTNPLSGTMRAFEWSTSNRKRLQLFGADIANRCLWLVIKAYYTPGSSVTVHNAYYYTTGNSDFH